MLTIGILKANKGNIVSPFQRRFNVNDRKTLQLKEGGGVVVFMVNYGFHGLYWQQWVKKQLKTYNLYLKIEYFQIMQSYDQSLKICFLQ